MMGRPTKLVSKAEYEIPRSFRKGGGGHTMDITKTGFPTAQGWVQLSSGKLTVLRR